MKRFWIRKVFGFICLAIVGVTVFSGIVMLLWNNLLPVLFHFPLITFWQALGLLLLCKILFGGFRGGGPRREWKDKMKQKWMNMTPEEKEKFKEDWGRRCRRPFDPSGRPFDPSGGPAAGRPSREEEEPS